MSNSSWKVFARKFKSCLDCITVFTLAAAEEHVSVLEETGPAGKEELSHRKHNPFLDNLSKAAPTAQGTAANFLVSVQLIFLKKTHFLPFHRHLRWLPLSVTHSSLLSSNIKPDWVVQRILVLDVILIAIPYSLTLSYICQRPSYSTGQTDLAGFNQNASNDYRGRSIGSNLLGQRICSWRKFSFHSSQNIKALWLSSRESFQPPVGGFQGGFAKDAVEAAVIKEQSVSSHLCRAFRAWRAEFAVLPLSCFHSKERNAMKRSAIKHSPLFNPTPFLPVLE